MSRRLTSVLVVSALAGLTWTAACGDGATEPPPPPPSDPLRPASVTVTPATVRLTALGATAQLSVEVRDQHGRAMAGATVTWSSNVAAVATVNASGLVTAVGSGTATITATAGSASGTSTITVAQSQDRAALVALYNATDGPNWVDNENWLTDRPLREWYGVDTDSAGRVVRLDLGGRSDNETVPHGLAGPVPAELGNLSKLERLSLRYNDLTGPIPAELGRLSRLGSLVLSGNELSGPIPAELGNLTNLEALWLNGNELTDPIPAELGSLTALRHLALSTNELTGPIPIELGNLPRLEFLALRANELTGTIPPELGNLVNLDYLSLANNELAGPIPRSFLQLRRLDRMFVSGNNALCLPGISAFASWVKQINNHDLERVTACNSADQAALESLYEATGGHGWTESTNWLGDHAIDEWYGTTTDSLGRVTELDLASNGLTGGIPASLAHLAELIVLRIGGNALSGRLPLSLSRLPLREFHYADTELCTPADASFEAWIRTLASHEGTGVECEPISDREILDALYHATDGPNWINADNWLTDAPLGDWYGVRADGEGAVTSLRLRSNDLAGSIPPEIGDFSALQGLWLDGNELSGTIPPQIGNLATLNALSLGGNALTGPIPPELGDLSSLTFLGLGPNALDGVIPPELGRLASLQRFLLWSNRLTGPIPPELGRLSRVTTFHIQDNALTGPIPEELGGLASATWLLLSDNNLTGPIPSALGRLSALERLSLGNNELSGPIPPEIGDLSALESLWFNGNKFSGPIPAEIGKLSSLERLSLDDNDLSGPVPRELAALSGLRELGLTNNTGMAGPLPTDLTALRQLEALLAGGTNLCAPNDPAFQAWLDGVYRRRIAPCIEGDSPAAYLTQAVQSWEFPVPLVAGKKALLRVFPTSRRDTDAGIPAVRARFYRDGRETHLQDIPSQSTPIPTDVDQGDLAKSANADIPGDVIQPGLEIVIEVDPEGTLDPALGVATRIPQEGRLAVEVHEMPSFDLTLIPFIWTQTQDSSLVGLIEAVAASPETHELLSDTRTLLPIGDLHVTAHEPVLSSSNSAFDLLRQTVALRAMEAGAGYYKGMMSRPVTGAGGIARLPGRSSFSQPLGDILAHELGHNLNLRHAPCGGAAGPDRSYPYTDGSIGAWGYDIEDEELLPPSTPDLMTYCGPPDGSSDYHFTNALRFRLSDADSVGLPDRAPRTRSLLVWGGVGADTVPYLEPSFVIDAPPELPRAGGEYRLTGRTGRGTELFSLAFDMPEVADGDGSSSFAFVLPVRPEWEGSLAAITLTGPSGSFTLDGESDIPMAILRNQRTGQVRGFLRELPAPTQAAMAAAGVVVQSGLEVLFSRGIPDAVAWRQ